MATTRAALTEEDIRTLLKGATADVRAAAARKLCQKIDRAPLTAEERAVAAEILRIMAADSAELVRRALATTLKASPLLPRDVALRLARDVESVCLPVLTFSPVFSDEDLADIVRLGGPIRQLAVARRETLARPVTDALARHGSEKPVAAACTNDKADFSEAALQRIVDRFQESERVLTAVAYRSVLPLSVSERLLALVGEEARQHLAAKDHVGPDFALELAFGAVERATIDLVEQAGRTADVKAFAAHLRETGKLTASLMLRALAQGHMTFFEWAVAELAGVPHHRTWLMIHDAGPLGLKAIYERAGLPARLFNAFRAAIDTYHSMEFEGGPRDLQRFQQTMLQRFLTAAQPAGREDVDYLMERMDELTRSLRDDALVETA
jgi:uncharacterized protein (DUF2336 family)